MNAHVALAALACRALWRRPAFLVIASLTLALGMAALVAAATLVESLLVGPPPFLHQDRLVIYGQQLAGRQERIISPAAFAAIGAPGTVLAHGRMHVPTTVNLRVDGRAVLARARHIDAGFLPTLGIGSSRNGAWLSAACFRQMGLAGTDARAVDLFVDGERVPVAGVLPASFRFFGDIDLLLPLSPTVAGEERSANEVAIARLAPGVSVSAFGADVARRIAARPDVLVPNDHLERFGATPLREAITVDSGRPVIVFLACAMIQLAIAGINTCNLIRGRSLGRAYDLAIREALGASGGARWIPAAVDAVVLWGTATAGGLVLGTLLVAILATFVPDDWRLSALPIEPSVRVHVFAWLACLGVVVVATLVAVPGTRSADAARARMAVDGWPRAAPKGRLARGVVVLQAMLATTLLLPTLSATTRLYRLEGKPPGFDGAHALAIPLALNAAQFPTAADIDALFRGLRPRLLAMDGVQAAGFSTRLPVGDAFRMQFLTGGQRAMYQYALITPGAGEALGLQKVAGRWLSDGDRAGSDRVAMVNEAYVRATHGQGVGDTVQQVSRLFAPPPMRVVGVVADTRHAGAANPVEPMVFVPLAQVSEASFAYIRPMLSMYVALRGPSIDANKGDAFRELLRATQPYLATGEPVLLSGLARVATDEPRRQATLLALFALPAMLLAGLGLYSVQATEAASRRRDIALSQALGATRRALLFRIFRPALTMACFGMVAGLAIAWLGRAWWPADACHATAVVASVVSMIAVSLGATTVPAFGVLSVAPHHVLRGQS